MSRAGGLLALPDDLLSAVAVAASVGAADATLASMRLTCKGLLAPADAAARSLRLRVAPQPDGGLQLAHFPSVRELDASEAGCHAGGDAWLVALRQVCCGRVVCSCCTRVCCSVPAAAPNLSSPTRPQTLPALEGLRLGRLQPLTAVGADAVAHLSRLSRLDLGGSTLYESAAARLAPLARTLRTLSLRECCSLSDVGLAALLGNLPLLQDVDLSLCGLLGDATLAQLSCSTQLAKLDLTGCEGFRCAEGEGCCAVSSAAQLPGR
jgi:hypothetical protein